MSTDFMSAAIDLVHKAENLRLEGTDWSKNFNYHLTVECANMAAWICKELIDSGLPVADTAPVTDAIKSINHVLDQVQTFDSFSGDYIR